MHVVDEYWSSGWLCVEVALEEHKGRALPAAGFAAQAHFLPGQDREGQAIQHFLAEVERVQRIRLASVAEEGPNVEEQADQTPEGSAEIGCAGAEACCSRSARLT